MVPRRTQVATNDMCPIFTSQIVSRCAIYLSHVLYPFIHPWALQLIHYLNVRQHSDIYLRWIVLVLGGYMLRSGVAGSCRSSILIFEETTYCFGNAVTNVHPHQNVCLLSPHAQFNCYLLTLMTAHLRIALQLIMVLMCISPVVKRIGYLFLYLL